MYDSYFANNRILRNTLHAMFSQLDALDRGGITNPYPYGRGQME